MINTPIQYYIRHCRSQLKDIRIQCLQKRLTTNRCLLPPDTKRPIYIVATHQHAGTTTTCLAILSGLSKRFPNSVGYIKPVGHRYVNINNEDEHSRIVRVDKDVALIRGYFQLHHIASDDMSPLIITRGYTRKYIDGNIDHDFQMKYICNSVKRVRNSNDIVVCEGAGSAGMGSIVGASNGRVASLIGADMVLVANGGLGSTFDELELNREYCKYHNVHVAGVVMNKVMIDKYDQSYDYMSRALMKRWNIPLLGCIPDNPYLGCPALIDLERIFETKLITGKNHRFRHYEAKNTTLVGASIDTFLENFKQRAARTLYLCHITREDIILAFLEEYQRWKKRKSSISFVAFEGALIICGREGKYEISNDIKEKIISVEKEYAHEDGGVPIMLCNISTYTAIEIIHNCTPMLHLDDVGRVNTAVNHYEHHINFDLLLQRTGHVSST